MGVLIGRKAVLAKFGGRCAYCGTPLTLRAMHRDHVEPLVRYKGKRYTFSGRRGCKYPERHNADNVVPACQACNMSKSNLDLETWRGSLRWLGWQRGIVFWFERYKECPTQS